jgi:arylsulfatase A-like enzyme
MNRPDKPNLLFIFTDEQRQDTLGAYGNRLIKTPHLDALARQSLVFDRAYVTQPVCTPSRASILTGVYPHGCGMYENNRVLPASIVSFGEMIEDRDYIKAYFGKWHLGDEEIPQRGFEEKWVCMEEMYKPRYTKEAYKREVADYHRFLVEHGRKPDSELEGVPVFSRHFAAALPENLSKPCFLAAEVIKFLREIGDRPFVLYLGFLEPHEPFFSAFDGMYDHDEVPLPGNSDHRPGDDAPLRTRYLVRFFEQHGWPDRYGRRDRLDNERAWRELASRYWGAVSLVDKYVGAVLDALQELGLSEKTVTVFTSDHGDMMGSHGLAAKGGHMYEETLKVPLFLRIPWLSGAIGRVGKPVSQIDLVPTLLDILGQPPHSQLQGESWLPGIEGKRLWSDEPVVAEWKGKNGDRWIGYREKGSEPCFRLMVGSSTVTRPASTSYTI